MPTQAAGAKPRASFPGTLDALEPLRAYVKEAGEAAGLDRSAVYNLCLAIDEIATNVVLYGYEQAGLAGDVGPRQVDPLARGGRDRQRRRGRRGRRGRTGLREGRPQHVDAGPAGGIKRREDLIVAELD